MVIFSNFLCVLLFSVDCVVFGHLSSTFFLARFKHPTHGILFVSYQLSVLVHVCGKFLIFMAFFLMILK